MSKKPLDNFVTEHLKNNKKIPGVGQYDIENVKIATKGLGKGWK